MGIVAFFIEMLGGLKNDNGRKCLYGVWHGKKKNSSNFGGEVGQYKPEKKKVGEAGTVISKEEHSGPSWT
jgi:hypothetical protein